MKRTVRWLVALAWIAWAMPAAADVPNDDCGIKEAGDTCEDYAGETGVCVEASGEPIYCDTTAQPAVDAGPRTDAGDDPDDNDGDKDEDDGCSVRRVSAGGRGEAAALGLLLLICIALRKRFD